MEDSYDKSKIIDCMFDPNISEILAELEHGGKEISHLVEKSGISEVEMRNQLSYLLEHNFLIETIENGKTVFSANAEKLAKIMENEENFEGAMDGLAKMDSYLN